MKKTYRKWEPEVNDGEADPLDDYETNELFIDN